MDLGVEQRLLQPSRAGSSTALISAAGICSWVDPFKTTRASAHANISFSKANAISLPSPAIPASASLPAHGLDTESVCKGGTGCWSQQDSAGFPQFLLG